MTPRRKLVTASAADLRVNAEAETTVTVGEPILPHGIALSVRCKLAETAAVTVWLVTLAREIDGKLTLSPHEMPQADHVPAGALDVPDEGADVMRRRRRPGIGF